MVKFNEVVNSKEFKNSEMRLPIALGKDSEGNNIVIDLAKMPHLLVAGTTGSGKSVCLDTIIMSLSKQDVDVILVDPKIVGLMIYKGAKFLMCDPITDAGVAETVFIKLVREMNDRYQKMVELSVRSIDDYNKKSEEKMRRIVVIIDEFSDLVYQNKHLQETLTVIAQKSRACGIHLVLTTQRPSADVITGVLKANLTGRIALKVTSSVDSRVILDRVGAENLNGDGDMIVQVPGKEPIRIQGAYISEEEVRSSLEYGKREVKEEVKEDTNYLIALEALRNNPAREVSVIYIKRITNLHYRESMRIYNKMLSEGVLV